MITNKKLLFSHRSSKMSLKKMSEINELSMNLRKEKDSVSANGISYFRKTCNYKKKLAPIIFKCKGRESSSKKLFIKMKENCLKQIECLPCFKTLKIRGLLLSI